MATRHRFQVDDEPHTVEVDEQRDRITVRVDGGDPIVLDATTSGVPGLFSIIIDGEPRTAYVTRDGKNLRVLVEGRVFILGPSGAAGRGRLPRSP